MKKILLAKSWYFIILLILIFIVLAFVFRRNLIHLSDKMPEPKPVPVHVPLKVYGIIADSFDIHEDTVKLHENLSAILTEYKISSPVIAYLADSFRNIFDFRKIRPGNKFMVLTDKDTTGRARYFIYEADIVDFIVCRLDSPYTVYRDHKESDTVLHSMSAVIDTSLWVDMISRGATPDLIVNLADIFAWQIDFFGITEGDQVKVIYEEIFVEGQSVGIGKIKSAWFQHSGEEFYAFCYKRDTTRDMPEEYFDEKGNCLRRMFLKAPLSFSRISSGFTRARFHPILRMFRPHTGIDYAAPRGTPVHTVGDGVVTSAGYSGGAGNMVVIRHNSTYTTAYNHLSRYGKGIRRGRRVRQGDIIGYVGSTGLSTGPHLDFRMWKNGVPINPLRMKFPTVKALEKKDLPEFNKVKEYWTAELAKIPVEKL